ncbi:MAG TPA: carboxypeptidase regulatory-like domain-containing protein [Candidatus Sulfotelmatobacter sp.]|nr:carboxypeptidase regulatory-like domain-containing protein [Candidatus Sulfotelmatobacter sp.]
MIRVRMALLVVALSGFLTAQDGSVRGKINILQLPKDAPGHSDVVIWLAPRGSSATVSPGPTPRLTQKNKQFLPHVLAITVGTQVEFPNQDPFFHDVFSIYRGKPFDLGLYESGATRKVRFSQPGVSFIFCNIHPEMSAAVVALTTPYFTVSAPDGNFQINHVPVGPYKLEIWYEHSSESELTSASRDLDIAAGNNDVPPISLHSAAVPHNHLNKYGEPYPLDKPEKY